MTRESPYSSPPGSPESSPPSSPRSSYPASSSAASVASKSPTNKVCHFHRPHRTAENGGPKTCTSGSDCKFVHAKDEKDYAAKQKAERTGKGARGSVGTTSSGFLLAAALSAALPNIADSTVVTPPFMFFGACFCKCLLCPRSSRAAVDERGSFGR